MVFRKVAQRFVGKSSHDISIDAWNAARRQCVTESYQKQQTAKEETLERISWLAMVCHLEEIDPATLALPQQLLESVKKDMEELRAMKPFEGYAWCLEKLRTADEKRPGEAEEQRVDHQE